MSLPRRGVTLIEIILSLALTVMIVGMIGTVLGRQAAATDTARRNVQTAELANAILNLIADDLRGTQIAYEVVSFNDAALQVPAEEEEAEEAEADEAADGEASEDEFAEFAEEELEETALPVGLYGTNVFLRMDSTKARRPGRRWVTSSDEAAINPISELRTISYGMDVVTSPSALVGLLIPGQEFDSNQPVLMRSTRDRAVSAFFAANLGGDDEQLFAKPLATEVALIEFRYGYRILDGGGSASPLQWANEWDTVENGGLPLAVEIRLVMNPSPEANMTMDQLASQEIDYTFRRTVQIPSARILTEQEDTQ